MNKREIVRRQLDDKILPMQAAAKVSVPSSGWIYAIRYALNMSLRQLGQKLSITAQGVKDIEIREKNGSVSLRVMRQVASALHMKFYYGFVPEDGTLEKMIEKRALELAENIVHRTSIQMDLEDQAISRERIRASVSEMAGKFAKELPKLLWD
jgi:predicted DNA-binding mobile mystery protein A